MGLTSIQRQGSQLQCGYLHYGNKTKTNKSFDLLSNWMLDTTQTMIENAVDYVDSDEKLKVRQCSINSSTSGDAGLFYLAVNSLLTLYAIPPCMK